MIGAILFACWGASLVVAAWVGFDRGFAHGRDTSRWPARKGLD